MHVVHHGVVRYTRKGRPDKNHIKNCSAMRGHCNVWPSLSVSKPRNGGLQNDPGGVRYSPLTTGNISDAIKYPRKGEFESMEERPGRYRLDTE
jgi:hypothetical protein